MSKGPKILEKYVLFVNGKRKEIFEAPNPYAAQVHGLGHFKSRVGKLVDGRGRKPSR